MIRARLIAVMPLILGGAVCAQSANEIVTPLESCVRSSRLADAICMRQNDPAQRLDCLHKVSAAQLQCLEHTLPKGAAASEDSSRTVPSEPPANAASSKGASPKAPGRTEPPGVLPKGTTASGENEPPPGGCKPIGVTASGEIVFPMACRDFIEQHKALDRKPGTAEAKPADEDPKPDAKDAKPAVAQATAIRERKPVTNQTDEATAETGNRAAEPATTGSLPKRTKAGKRTADLLCAHFRTYDATSGTYRAYDGRLRQCRQGEGN
jgi:BA14K-like protein